MTAATIAGATMKFDIVADSRGFTSAVSQIEQQWKAATESMSGEGGSWGDRFISVTDQIGASMTSLAEPLKEVFSGSADAAETAMLGAFNKIKSGAEGLAASLGSSLGKKFGGEFGARVGEALGRYGSQAATEYMPKLAEGLEAALNNDRVQNAIRGMHAFAASLDAASGSSLALKDRLESAITGMQQFAQVAQGKAMAADAFTPMIEALDKVIAKHERNIELIGKTVAEQAKLRAQWQMQDAEGYDSMSDAQKATAKEKVNEVGAAAAQEQAAKSAQEQAKAYASITLQFDRQIELAAAKRVEEGMTAGQLAEERMIRDGIAKMQQRGRDLSAEELDILVDQAHQLRIITEENTRAATVKNAERNADRALMASFAQRRELGANAGEIAEMRYLNAEFQRAREANVALSAEMIAKMEQNARSIGMVTQATAELRERFQQIQAAGATVSRALEDAFSSFMSGTQVKWREWVADLIAEMAKLTLRTQVLQPLFGGGAGNPAGLIGSMLQGMFGGARADGGPVTSGRSYLVGERGPELFVPQSAGTILPQVPTGPQSMQQITIAPQIDARGATPDAVAALEARIPGILLETWADARERGAIA